MVKAVPGGPHNAKSGANARKRADIKNEGFEVALPTAGAGAVPIPIIPIIFIFCPQDEQKTTAKSTLHFLDTEAKQAMFKAFQNLGRIEPQFDAADPS